MFATVFNDSKLSCGHLDKKRDLLDVRDEELKRNKAGL